MYLVNLLQNWVGLLKKSLFFFFFVCVACVCFIGQWLPLQNCDAFLFLLEIRSKVANLANIRVNIGSQRSNSTVLKDKKKKKMQECSWFLTGYFFYLLVGLKPMCYMNAYYDQKTNTIIIFFFSLLEILFLNAKFIFVCFYKKMTEQLLYC